MLTEWFRKPQRRFGTTYPDSQFDCHPSVATILLSRGNIDLLGEAYAFGVIWSFAMNALSVLCAPLQACRTRANGRCR